MPSLTPAEPAPAAVASDAAAPARVAWYSLVALVLAPLVLYSGSLGAGLIGLDDLQYFHDNAALHHGTLAGLRELWSRPYFDDYAPITQLTIWLDLAVSHDGSYVLARIHQLLWFGLSALAVFQTMRRLSGSSGVGWAVAVLYVVHPVCSESALWLAERKNLVAIALCLWSIERHIAWRQGAGRGALILALALCPLAQLAKAHAVMIPAVIGCYEAILGSGTLRRRLQLVLPSAVLTLIFIVVCMRVFRLYGDHPLLQVGGSLGASILCDGAILARYLGHALLPHHLALFYCVDEDVRRWPELAAWWALVAGAVAATLAIARRRRLVAFAWCAAGAAILPAINLRPLPLAMSDHYLHWSLPWLLLVVVVVAEDLAQSLRAPQPLTARWLTAAAGGLLAVVALGRVPEFSSLPSLARSGIVHQGDCAINWGMYCFAEEHASPPDLREAGRAGIIAYACSDYQRQFAAYKDSCAILGAIECRKTYGDQAAAQLLVKALAGRDPQVQRNVVGTVLFMEERYAQAAQALGPLYTPSLQAAAQAIGSACRLGLHQPWELEQAEDLEGRQELDGKRADDRRNFSVGSFCMLSSCLCRTGNPAGAFDLAALLVNMDPDNSAALGVYCDACHQLGLTQSATLALTRMAGLAAPVAVSTP